MMEWGGGFYCWGGSSTSCLVIGRWCPPNGDDGAAPHLQTAVPFEYNVIYLSLAVSFSHLSPPQSGMYARMRRPNWTDEESLLLAQLIEERKEIIRRKCSAGVTSLAKRQAWEEIAQTINIGFPQYQRTVADCTKKWENLLAKARNEIKRQRMHIGRCNTVSRICC